MKDLTLKTRVEQMLKQVGADRDLSEVPMAQKRRIPKSLEQYRQLSTSRDKAIAAVYASGGYSMKEIGRNGKTQDLTLMLCDSYALLMLHLRQEK